MVLIGYYNKFWDTVLWEHAGSRIEMYLLNTSGSTHHIVHCGIRVQISWTVVLWYFHLYKINKKNYLNILITFFLENEKILLCYFHSNLFINHALPYLVLIFEIISLSLWGTFSVLQLPLLHLTYKLRKSVFQKVQKWIFMFKRH